jgi:threonine synthase
MKYCSANNPANVTDFRNAVLRSIAEDGGLFMPAAIPAMSPGLIRALPGLTLPEIALKALSGYVGDMPKSDLQHIVAQAFNFDAPLIALDHSLFVLELFHGPTLAFKDFGARFLAQCLAFFNKDENRELLILAATSGDTGSAVANSFYGKAGIKVGLLYPGGMVSRIQEQQLTTIGGNIHAFEVQGTFDDCQRLVKCAFADPEIRSRCNLSSANSINIARLLPQSVYYFHAWGQLQKHTGAEHAIFTVPSGNFGNLTAGLIASISGLPVKRFIAALNANAVFMTYLEQGRYEPRPTIKTLSNAMDVGDPSNFARLSALFKNDLHTFRRRIFSESATDAETMESIRHIHQKYGYMIDPHGAVGCCALDKFRKQTSDKTPAIVLETAHPAKFSNIVEKALHIQPEMPARLSACLEKQKQATQISGQFEEFKEALIGMVNT